MTVMCTAFDFMTPTHKKPTTIKTKDKSNLTTVQFRMSEALQEYVLPSPLQNLPENTRGGVSEKSSLDPILAWMKVVVPL